MTLDVTIAYCIWSPSALTSAPASLTPWTEEWEEAREVLEPLGYHGQRGREEGRGEGREEGRGEERGEEGGEGRACSVQYSVTGKTTSE